MVLAALLLALSYSIYDYTIHLINALIHVKTDFADLMNATSCEGWSSFFYAIMWHECVNFES